MDSVVLLGTASFLEAFFTGGVGDGARLPRRESGLGDAAPDDDDAAATAFCAANLAPAPPPPFGSSVRSTTPCPFEVLLLLLVMGS